MCRMASDAVFVSLLLVRTRDKFKLCNYADSTFQVQRGVQATQSICRDQVDRILDRAVPAPPDAAGVAARANPYLGTAGGGGGPVDVSGVYKSFDARDVVYFLHSDPPIPPKPAAGAAGPAAEAADAFPRHLFAGVTSVVVASKGSQAYQRMGAGGVQAAACDLLATVHREFAQQYPADVVEVASRPFQFIKFDGSLANAVRRAHLSMRSTQPGGGGAAGGGGQHAGTLTRRGGVADHTGATPAQPLGVPSAGDAGGAGDAGKEATGGAASGHGATYDALKKELHEVHTVIKGNLDDILTRGERLETMAQYSRDLKDSSHTYYKRTQKMNRDRMLQLYGPPAAVALLLIAFLYWKFFW